MMTDETEAHAPNSREFAAYFWKILGPEREFYLCAIAYGVGISFLSLAVPISVQLVINSVANMGLAAPLVMLSATLFVLLLIAGLLNALRLHLMEIFARRFYARLVADVTLKTVYARNPYFGDHGKGDLFNRYFDIVTVQKTVPSLLIGGFTVVLQAAVGFVLVSFYHPYFLVFSLLFALIGWGIWRALGWSAIKTGIELSHRKYEAARWLENLGAANGFFKSGAQIAAALQRSDAATKAYLNARARHFRRSFTQAIGYFVLYAVASALLLGVGGWLVIRGELSLGQLVAAELILSAAFAGVAQLGVYLDAFYDLCAAIDELSLFHRMPVEEPSGAHQPEHGPAGLVFDNVRSAEDDAALFNFEIPPDAQIMAHSQDYVIQRNFVNLLKRHERPSAGVILFGGGDILDTELHVLRQEIIVLDRPSIIETSVRDYLALASGPDAASMIEALKIVGLYARVQSLPLGLDTALQTTGYPLSLVETLQLKLAGAILARPRLIVLRQIFDIIPEACIAGAVDWLSNDGHIGLLYFSNRSGALGFRQFLYLGADHQRYFDSLDALCAHSQFQAHGAPAPRLAPAFAQRV